MRNLLLKWLLGKDFAKLVQGYKPPVGKHNSLPVGSPTSWTWGRAGLSELGFTLNKLLKGAGAGADPTEIDVPTGKSVATGTYTGNEAGRQVTTGFKCSLVIITRSTLTYIASIYPNISLAISAAAHTASSATLHASNGFSLTASANEQDMNVSGAAYYYWAISE